MRPMYVRLIALTMTLAACGGSALEKPSAVSVLASSPASAPAQRNLLYEDIQFIDPRHGFVTASSNSGRLLFRTVDGGAMWQNFPLPYDGEVRFASPTLGWAVGHMCAGGGHKNSPPPACRAWIARSVDGGATWQQPVELATNWPGYGVNPFSFVRFVEARSGWALRRLDPCLTQACDVLYRTDDGGLTWQANPDPLPINTIEAIDRQHLWATASRALLFSGDGGLTWTTRLELKPDGWHSPTFQSIHFADPMRGWAFAFDIATCSASSCDGYQLYRTTDGGVTWREATTVGWRGSCGGILTEPRFAGSLSVWIGANHGAGGAGHQWGVLVSGDGGTSWTCHPSALAFRAVQPLDASRAYAIVDSGSDTDFMLTTDGGATWNDVPTP